MKPGSPNDPEKIIPVTVRAPYEGFSNLTAVEREVRREEGTPG